MKMSVWFIAFTLDVALGKVDSIDVMGSNHVATMPLWYRLLNCGFHVPASAGTDCFLNRVRSRLPGQDRVYVHVDGEFNYERWIESLKAGRTFVTNGPMFDFHVNDVMPGDTIKLAGPGEVQLLDQANPFAGHEGSIPGGLAKRGGQGESRGHTRPPAARQFPVSSGRTAVLVPRIGAAPTGRSRGGSSSVTTRRW